MYPLSSKLLGLGKPSASQDSKPLEIVSIQKSGQIIVFVIYNQLKFTKALQKTSDLMDSLGG